ncbi:DsbA family protein [Pseudonocardia sp. CA-107938]|uniref:DsbA family protein n=1 Tax=Pseudonocardia sp. CA-107938 TaxID=3240021 RepID=UPI003D921A19
MSGGARNAKRRQQAEREARLAAAGIRVPQSKADKNRVPMIAAGIVIALVVVVAGGWYWFSTRPVTPTFTATASGAVVTAGTGPVVIDVYEDFLCPGCLALEKRDGNKIITALNDGKLTVKYHMLGLLDARTKPAGYSTRAADASLCAAAAGIYGAYHQKLFNVQPAENSAGLTDDQLVSYGTDLGAGADFAACVKGTKNDAAIKKETDAATSAAGLKNQGVFGTPTVAKDGKRIDINASGWLDTVLAGK